MICKPCRDNDHERCPEKTRQSNPASTRTALSCGEHCYCAHQPGSVLREDRKADPRRGA